MRDDVGGPGTPEPSEPPRSDTHLLPAWAFSDRFVPRTVVRPLQEFLQTSTAGGVLLLAAVVVALIWVNSPWRAAYDALWHTEFTVHVGSFIDLEEDLKFWVNDGLMALFFLVVGLEIKRELVTGELRAAPGRDPARRWPRSAAWWCRRSSTSRSPAATTRAAGASRWPPTSRSRWVR